MSEAGASPPLPPPPPSPLPDLSGKVGFVALASMAVAATGTAVVVVAVYRWRGGGGGAVTARGAACADAGGCECDGATVEEAAGECHDTGGQVPAAAASDCGLREAGGGESGSESDSGYHGGGETAPAAAANPSHCDNAACSSSQVAEGPESAALSNAADSCQTTSLVQFEPAEPVAQSAGYILVLGRDVQLAQGLLSRISRSGKCVSLDARQSDAPTQPEPDQLLEHTRSYPPCVASAPISLVVYIVDSADVPAADVDLRWLLCDGELAAKLATTPVLIVGAIGGDDQADGGGGRCPRAAGRGALLLSLARQMSPAVRARGRKVNVLLCDRTGADCEAVADAAGKMAASG